MENECLFVSERGYEFDIPHKILKIEDIPKVLQKLKNKDTLFCHSDYLPYLCQALHFVNVEFYLVSGRSDYVVTPDINTYFSFFCPYLIDVSKFLLSSPKILKWFAVNCLSKHNKLIPIPIGIDYHTMLSPNHTLFESYQANPVEQEKTLLDIKSSLRSLSETLPKAITNFQNAMESPPVRKIYRTEAYENLKGNKDIIWLPRQSRTDFWKSCDENMFVISPFGNGPDTHRTYEVLCLGRIPIIQECEFNEFLYQDLPVVIIKKWSEVTTEFLHNKHKEILQNICENKYKYDRLYTKFWKNIIEQQ